MSSDASRRGAGGPSFVVEIGNDWLKMIQAAPARGGGLAVSRLYLEKYSLSAADPAQLIAQAMKKYKFARMPVIACLPRQAVNIRMLELPSTDPVEIADMVDLQVGKQTPYSKDEIVSDYKILVSDREGYSRVMLVIVQRGVLRQRFSVLEGAGLEVQRMSVSSEGLLNWSRCALGGAERVTAILDMDSGYSDFVVVKQGGLVFTRSIMVGAEQLSEDPDTWKEKLGKEIKQSIEMCQNEAQGRAPVRLVVTGAGARAGNIGEYLGECLALPTDVKDCLKIVTRMPAEPGVGGDGPYRNVSLTTLVGTALAPQHLEFNLVPDSIVLRRNLVAKAKTLTAFGILLMAFLVAASFFATLKLYFRKDTLARIEKEIRGNEPAVREIRRMMEIIIVDRDRRDARFLAVNLLSALHKLVPAAATLDLVNIDLEKEKGQVQMSGEGASLDDVQMLVSNLEKSPLFKDVKDTTKKGEGGAVFKFQIECALEK